MKVDVDITGKKLLKLVASIVDSPEGAHANWCDAKIDYTKESPAIISDAIDASSNSKALVSSSVQNFIGELDVYKKPQAPAKDWMIDNTGFKAGITKGASANEIVFTNGLTERTFRLAPAVATVSIRDLVGNRELIRGVKPEAEFKFNGRKSTIGGLKSQPDMAYLTKEWLDKMPS